MGTTTRTTHRRRRPGPSAAGLRSRLVLGRVVLVLALVAAGFKLVAVQGLQAAALSAQAAGQRTSVQTLPAQRGTITDRNGTPLAFSVAAQALYAQPNRITAEQRAIRADPDMHKQAMARRVAQVLGPAVSEQEILSQLRSDRTTVLLAPLATPAQARAIQQDFPEISAEHREIRQYPGGELAANVLGVANWRADERKVRGLVGLENYDDTLLAGRDGRRVVDTAEGSDAVIPGSERAERPPVPGSGLELTLDSDLQYTVAQMLTDYARRYRAKGASAVVLDARTAEVYAMVNDVTFDPNNLAAATPDSLGNSAVSAPFEPGSVNKVVTAAAAIESGVVTPGTPLQVPGELRIADRTVRDAWPHGILNLTFTGVLARSSNVGTLLTAQRVGADRFVDMLTRMGLGQRTNVGLPGESAGKVPPRDQWSGSTFANLPIGQGLSMTVLQMASMYQAIANDGLRIPPRIVSTEIAPDGTRTATPAPAGIRVVSPQTAHTVRDMLRAVVQNEPRQRGTAPEAALDGYQIAGKSGTAQQVDPGCSCYSNSNYWITFAGILPADAPRFVVGIMLDDPAVGSAAPLFHEIASYLAGRYQIPLSTAPSPPLTLTLP
ncbi:MAG TPA: penicillin-binding protein 2 [Pseudonocardiaceae bacterium]|jgi:cell division protein FtsI (penicillin-binding protein 3)|nr:penicillin-binding protein 2 [Pseudonocardiaceae bacterium]